ncbi:MAG TPA: Maf family protein [Candidatus Acidoferrales bacterium]|jgi:septum formation protein
MKLILASSSPRRARILSDAGIPFDVVATEIDESRHPGEPVAAMALRLAEAKARAAIAQRAAQARPSQELARAPQETTFFIGADTIVELDGDPLGKPASAEAARAMLGRLIGRSHRVMTGVAIVRMPGGHAQCEVETTDVRLAALNQQEIDSYVGTGEPLDKAGAYAIQGLGGRFIERVEGCYFNVVGLPLSRVCRILKELGWRPDC